MAAISATAQNAGELALIERIRRMAAALPVSPELQLGIGDDCAILRPRPGEEIVVTTDFCLEGRHWRHDWNSPESAGHRTLARGLSDLAAMGARPVAAFLSLALPAATARDHAWMDRFLHGLLALAGRWGMPLAGGDLSESPSEHVLADIVCLGAVPQGTALRRSGARPGDAIYVTGTLGEAATAMARAAREATNGMPLQETGADRFRFPEPRLHAGRQLRESGVITACMDLSDGLSTDLTHLCEASGVAAKVELAAIPQSRAVEDLSEAERVAALLHGGEDYELLVTAPAECKLPDLPDLRLARIGTIQAAEPRRPRILLGLAHGAAEPLVPQGWEHLQ